MGRLAVVLAAVTFFGMAGGVYYLPIHQPTGTADRAETVEGAVVTTDIESTSSDSGTSYAPVVRYEYRFDGEAYTNDRIKLVGGVGFPTPDGAEEFLEDYDAGDTVTVHVDPRNPSAAYLQRRSVGLMAYALVGFVALLGLFGVVGLVADVLGVDAANVK